MDHLWLALAWILYFVIHSVLALRSVKEYGYKKGLGTRKYRLLYVIVATLGLLAIVMYSSTIQTHLVLPTAVWLKMAGLFIAVQGLLIAKWGFKSYDTRAFLGLGSLKAEDEFKTDGLLKHVRHPLYAGSILMVIGYFLFDPKWTTLISGTLVILYFLVGIYLEERKLIEAFGEKYIEYKKKTPMLIPRFWK
ncbi:MAG: isoprenylcysteine carboxylmethyltransferase family protein [Cyclobacteriaceae bacterium]|nr:isoprenylcysteine carboxylmethyltransferase family protein [Cyclobacteriaceae bacterium]